MHKKKIVDTTPTSVWLFLDVDSLFTIILLDETNEICIENLQLKIQLQA